jgi:hypothetical protein
VAAFPAAGLGGAEPVQFYYGDPPAPRRAYGPPPVDRYDAPAPRQRGYYPSEPPRRYAPQPRGYAPQPRYGYGDEPAYFGESRKEKMKEYVKDQRQFQKEQQKDRVRAWNRQNGF